MEYAFDILQLDDTRIATVQLATSAHDAAILRDIMTIKWHPEREDCVQREPGSDDQ